MEEVWKNIEVAKGYEVSNLGRVRSVERFIETKTGKRRMSSRLLSTFYDKDGYVRTRLVCNDDMSHNFYVHRLVASAFIPNTYNLKFINHKDEVKSNNRVDNLEWCSMRYNNLYGSGRAKRALKKQKKVYVYNLFGEFIASYPSVTLCAKYEEVNPSRISAVCLHKECTAKNRVFRYENDPFSLERDEKHVKVGMTIYRRRND